MPTPRIKSIEAAIERSRQERAHLDHVRRTAADLNRTAAGLRETLASLRQVGDAAATARRLGCADALVTVVALAGIISEVAADIADAAQSL